ncbi:MAG: diguanylate cyclase [Candidatus Aminicenantes bacterium]|nr:diguanylate cyclase [Candidatus Aminicenantes bacterium]
MADASPLNILIAEDDPVSSRLLQRSVENWGFKAVLARDGGEAWEKLRDPAIRLAVLDWEMPAADGPDLCRRLRAQPNRRYTYTILLTSRDKPEDIILGLEAGADDYMTKPVALPELRVRLQTGKRIIELEDKLLQNQKRLADLATKDGLTKLWNRRTILQFLGEEFAEGKRRKTQTGVVMIDVDHFKEINDTCGHLAGDRVLVALAQRLKKAIRPYDRIGRYGGDEILVVLPDCGGKDAAAIAERLRLKSIRWPAYLGKQALGFTLSIGVSSTEHLKRPTIDGLIQSADQALYEAKLSGRDRVVSAKTRTSRRARGSHDNNEE